MAKKWPNQPEFSPIFILVVLIFIQRVLNGIENAATLVILRKYAILLIRKVRVKKESAK